jgi:hypothetical protein
MFYLLGELQMSKKLRRDNWRVEIMPQSYSRQPTEQDCVTIVAQVKRHIDNVAYVQALCDAAWVCEHCGYKWTEKGDYNGGCCDKDEANNPDGEVAR